MRQKGVEQDAGIGPMGRERRLDEGDRPTDRGAVAVEHAGDEIRGHTATLPMMPLMIRHHVLISLRDDAKDVADQIVTELAAYAATRDFIGHYTVGRDLGLQEGTADVAVVAEFETADDYRTYATDEGHVDIIQRLILPNATQPPMRVQTEF